MGASESDLKSHWDKGGQITSTADMAQVLLPLSGSHFGALLWCHLQCLALGSGVHAQSVQRVSPSCRRKPSKGGLGTDLQVNVSTAGPDGQGEPSHAPLAASSALRLCPCTGLCTLCSVTSLVPCLLAHPDTCTAEI